MILRSRVGQGRNPNRRDFANLYSVKSKHKIPLKIMHDTENLSGGGGGAASVEGVDRPMAGPRNKATAVTSETLPIPSETQRGLK